MEQPARNLLDHRAGLRADLTYLHQAVELTLGGRCEIRPWRQGFDFEVLTVRHDGRRLVLRTPLHEVTTAAYEEPIDFGEVVAREAALYAMLRRADVPVPELLAWHRRAAPGERSWMLLEHLPHDEVTELNPRQHRAVGELARRIHSLTPGPGDPDEGPGGQGDPGFLRRRAMLRYRYAARHFDLPPADEIEPLLRTPDQPRVVVHMDLRPDNLCFRGDELVGVLDMSNALIAPRHVELGRMHGFGNLTPDFLTGYGDHDIDRRQVLAHSVDAIGLLVAIAVEELHDNQLLKQAGERMRHTVDELLRR